jgi:hypothetical protein
VPDKFPSSKLRRAIGSSTKVRRASPQRICPNPSRWNDVFEQLVEFSETHPCNPSRPPAPLILGGWAFSDDTDKMRVWRETVDWASANGCVGIVEGIADGDFYKVETPTRYSVGPMGGPCYRPWDFEAKVRPSEDELAKHLEYLSVHWADIAGLALSTVTCPIAFTGKKARRLLMQAEDTATPPWGGWSHRSSDEAMRRMFTRFRSAVNKAIRPHEVDHIEFITNPLLSPVQN